MPHMSFQHFCYSKWQTSSKTSIFMTIVDIKTKVKNPDIIELAAISIN